MTQSFYLMVASAALALVSAGAAVAQPSIGTTPLRTIMVNTLETAPAGIAADGTTLYVAGFNNRRIIKIADVVGAAEPSPTIFARTAADDTPAGPVTWASSRGLQNIKVGASGQILASGDQGTNGAILLYGADGTLLDGVYGTDQIGGFARRTTAADFYAGGFVFAETTTKRVGKASSDFSTLGTNFVTTADNYPRSIATVGDDLYVSVADNASPEKVAKLSGGTAGNVEGKTITADWYSQAEAVASSVRFNVNSVNYNGTDYVILSDPSNSRITFLNAATGAAALTLTAASHGLEAVSSATIVESGSSKYLAVSTLGASGSGNGRVVIYSIDGSSLGSGVNEWSLY